MNLTQCWTQCSNLVVYQVCFFLFLGAKKGGKRTGDLGVSHISRNDTFQKKHFQKSVLNLHLGVSNCQAVLTQFWLMFAFFYCKILFEDHGGGLVSISCVSQLFRLRNLKAVRIRGFRSQDVWNAIDLWSKVAFLIAICAGNKQKPTTTTVDRHPRVRCSRMPGEASNHFSERHQHHKGSRTT